MSRGVTAAVGAALLLAGLLTVAPAATAAGVLGDRVAAGVAMGQGDSLRSPNGIYSLVLQGDGNLVEYAGGRAIWTTATAGRGGSRLILQGDGNLVLYSGTGSAVWASYAYAPGPTALVLADDGGLATTLADGSRYWRIAPRGDQLPSGGLLRVGQILWSPSTQYRLAMQGDGNAVLYTRTDVPVWNSRTSGAMTGLYMGPDGRLAVLRTDGSVAWSAASGVAGAALTVTDDASAVVGRGDAVAWRTPLVPATLWRDQTLRPGAALTLGTARLIMQGDGNLVRYTGGTAVWSSRTRSAGSSATMQTDGNLVVYSAAGVAQWSSQTARTNATYVRLSGVGLAFLGDATRVPNWIEGPPNWAGLAKCESGGNPRAVNPAGYYGLYQFDLGTWASNGGTGNPVDASPAVQTAVASTLYLARGRQPWPVCGKHL